VTPDEAIALLRVRQQQERYDMVERHERERIVFLDRQRREFRDLALRQEAARELVRSAKPEGHA